jgi:hypothetical protein
MSTEQPKEAPKQFTLTPEVALNFLDQVAAKFQGTRTDHHALEASMALLKSIVVEWQQTKEVKVVVPVPSKGRPKG